MKNLIRSLLCVFFILGINVLCFGETQKDAAAEQMTMEDFVESYNEEVRVNREAFDEYFSDYFFKTSTEPFKELQRSGRLMRQMLHAYNKEYVERAWQEWYNERLGVTDLRIQKEEKDGKVYLRITVKDIDPAILNISVDEKRIKIDGNIVVQEKGNVIVESGTGTGSSTYGGFLKILPVPVNALVADYIAKIDRGDILLIFNRKPENEIKKPPKVIKKEIKKPAKVINKGTKK